MANAHTVDREAAADERSFAVRSASADEAVDVAQLHRRELHGRAYTEAQLRRDHPRTV